MTRMTRRPTVEERLQSELDSLGLSLESEIVSLQTQLHATSLELTSTKRKLERAMTGLQYIRDTEGMGGNRYPAILLKTIEAME